MGLKAYRKRYKVSLNSELVNDVTIPERINALLAKPIGSSDREIVKSMQNHFNRRSALSKRQYDFFCSIESRYSAEKITQTNEWIANFDEEKRARFLSAVEYYKSTSYFTDIVRIAIANSGYVPSEKHYKSMCHNKYFDKALQNYNSPPKYSLADLVVFRDNRRTYSRDKSIVGMIEAISDKGCFQTGGRSYKLLIIGQEDSIAVTEDEIKLYRAKKNV